MLPLAQLLWDTAFQPSAAALAYTVLWGLLLVGTTLVHELGHAFAARRVGCKVHEIILWPLGGLTSKDPAASPEGEPLIPKRPPHASGPALRFTPLPARLPPLMTAAPPPFVLQTIASSRLAVPSATFLRWGQYACLA